ncbi:DUF1772 domain-containing protein [Herbiconiux sp. CPCC 205763]|uniref:DUF1772 domain-containing protein n=1 Tax=Herbiconiux aconitum TaxID=2970913 RepID=A0ABT2GP45_9MICO|nr:anthrone oxygenase family protein [Herbiconiux aconitum]MCS5717989.1 DUF1772 domain-containing protein [Herbiconiux aconitum]
MTEPLAAVVAVVAVTGASALGAAVVGGVFFAFSGFVMRALGDTTPSAGLAVMQAINRTAVRPPLMITLFGTLLAGLAACILLVVTPAGPALWWAVAGEAVYLVGVIGLTVGFHVPRNNAIDRLDAGSTDAVPEWSTYLTEWTRGNHVRALAGVIAAVLFGIAAGLASTL